MTSPVAKVPLTVSVTICCWALLPPLILLGSILMAPSEPPKQLTIVRSFAAIKVLFITGNGVTVTVSTLLSTSH